VIPMKVDHAEAGGITCQWIHLFFGNHNMGKLQETPSRKDTLMPCANSEEIVGYRLNDDIVCTNCATTEEEKDADYEEIILESELDDKNSTLLYFCCRCDMRMPTK